MASAIPAASGRGSHPSAPADRGMQGLQHQAEGPLAADAGLEAVCCTTRHAVMQLLSQPWCAAKHPPGSASPGVCRYREEHCIGMIIEQTCTGRIGDGAYFV
jgi:hypothetical protein